MTASTIGPSGLQGRDRDKEGIFLCPADKPKGEWDLFLKGKKKKKQETESMGEKPDYT